MIGTVAMKMIQAISDGRFANLTVLRELTIADYTTKKGATGSFEEILASRPRGIPGAWSEGVMGG